jgi:hypothetical protein
VAAAAGLVRGIGGAGRNEAIMGVENRADDSRSREDAQEAVASPSLILSIVVYGGFVVVERTSQPFRNGLISMIVTLFALRLSGKFDTAPTPTGFAEIVGDDFPVLHLIVSTFGHGFT